MWVTIILPGGLKVIEEFCVAAGVDDVVSFFTMIPSDCSVRILTAACWLDEAAVVESGWIFDSNWLSLLLELSKTDGTASGLMNLMVTPPSQLTTT